MKKKRLALKIILGVIALALIVWVGSTAVAQIVIRRYIRTFDSADVPSQIVPSVESEGFVAFRTDRDFNIMQVNDIHLGGGIATLKKDKKTVYEVMTMIQKEKPDFVILNGDSIFAVPSFVFNGGGTFNNRMVSREIAMMMDKLEVYWSITFGNHDTEAFDWTNRENLGKMYMTKTGKYCVFNSDFSEYGVTNQCILLKNSKGKITKAIMLLDSNDYVDNSISSSINWRYDTIHDCQVDWACDVLTGLSDGKDAVKSLFFFHIPVGEFVLAYRDLEANGFKDTAETSYISGFWDELIDAEMGERIWYGGCSQKDKAPEDVDNFFEKLGPDGINSLEGVFCAHDHVNTAVVKYRGVTLSYGNSIDNIAYDNIANYGLQRGAVVITVSPDGSWTQVHKNAYKDYGVSNSKFFSVDTSSFFYDGVAPQKGLIK